MLKGMSSTTDWPTVSPTDRWTARMRYWWVVWAALLGTHFAVVVNSILQLGDSLLKVVIACPDCELARAGE
jgi:hypothetical protein